MSRNRAAVARAAETGETYQQALQALGLDRKHAQPSRLILPPTDPYTGRNRCPRCDGGRYRTDITVDMPGDPGRPVLVCQVFCPRCLGCGRAPEHKGCRTDEHASPEEVGLDPYGYDDENEGWDIDAEPEERCPSCQGRTWWPMQAFNDDEVFWVRAPCGCSTPLLVPAPAEGEM